MNQVMNVDYFINKFSAIPEDKWCVDSLENENGQRCAYGHCVPSYKYGVGFGEGGTRTDESVALSGVLINTEGVIDINNGNSLVYRQPTPKQRILAALMDVKKAEYPEITDPPVYIDNYVYQDDKAYGLTH